MTAISTDKCDARQKTARFTEIVRRFIGRISGCADLIHDDVINHA
jgi:hypothetical protein